MIIKKLQKLYDNFSKITTNYLILIGPH